MADSPSRPTTPSRKSKLDCVLLTRTPTSASSHVPGPRTTRRRNNSVQIASTSTHVHHSTSSALKNTRPKRNSLRPGPSRSAQTSSITDDEHGLSRELTSKRTRGSREAKDKSRLNQQARPRALHDTSVASPAMSRLHQLENPVDDAPQMPESSRPAKRPRVNDGDDDIALHTAPTPNKTSLNDTEADFEMLDISEVVLLPWFSTSNDDGLYLPSAVQGLIDGMQRSLTTERTARQKAEEQHTAELRLRIAAEDETRRLRAEYDALELQIALLRQDKSARVDADSEIVTGAEEEAGASTGQTASDAGATGLLLDVAEPLSRDIHATLSSPMGAATFSVRPAGPLPPKDAIPPEAEAVFSASSSSFSLPIWGVRDSLNRLFPSHGK